MNNKNVNIVPTVSYPNMEIDKHRILCDNKRKSGIYRITNLTNTKTYIGSSNDLNVRFRVYFNNNCLIYSNMPIYKAILKYGCSSFTLDILEYCEKDILIIREQYYFDLLKPEYNVLKIAGSSLGFKHSLKTRAQMSLNNTGVNHPLYGKNHTHDTKIKLGKVKRSNLTINIEPNIFTDVNTSKWLSRCASLRVNIKVFNEFNDLVNEFPSMKSAAKYLGVSTSSIRRILNNDIIHVGFTYKFEVMNNKVWIYDHNHKLLIVLDNIKKASVWSNTPPTSLSRCIKSGKLYKNKFYFYNYKPNL